MTSPGINFDKRVEQFVALRDKIKTIKEKQKAELEPFNAALEKLGGILLGHLNATGAENVGTGHGTVYRKMKKSATIADREAFWAYCVAQGEFDLFDIKANAVAVEAHINEKVEAAKTDPTIVPGPPPGINFTAIAEVGVQRASKK